MKVSDLLKKLETMDSDAIIYLFNGSDYFDFTGIQMDDNGNYDFYIAESDSEWTGY